MSNCLICKQQVDTENVIHGKCYLNLCDQYKSKIILEHKKPKKCIVCDKTLPPKTIGNIHKKCCNEKQKENKLLIQVCRDKSECIIQY